MPDTGKIAVLTGGGDCPGLNAALRALVQACVLRHGIEVIGVRDGFKGLTENRFVPLDLDRTAGIFARGGTILGSSNVDTPFAVPVVKDGATVLEDRSDAAVENLRRAGAAALVVIGGDGTLAIAQALAAKGVRIIGIPKTIDNDLNGTELTIGFFTAVGTAVEAIDRLHTTAESHHRILVVEVMGRNAGWIALFAGLAGDADAILIPEIPYAAARLAAQLDDVHRRSRRYSIVVVSEGARPVGGDVTVSRIVEHSPERARLGGVAHRVAAELESLTGRETRAIVLGHLLRGGAPVAFDRILASRFGVMAADAVASGRYGTMLAWCADNVELVPLETGAGKNRYINPLSPFMQAARARGISFGD